MGWKRPADKMKLPKGLPGLVELTIEAQRRTLALIEFLIDKTNLFDRLKGQLNDRQQKGLLRMFKEDPDGFKGGLSAGKYSTITGASPATATRDLVTLRKRARSCERASSDMRVTICQCH